MEVARIAAGEIARRVNRKVHGKSITVSQLLRESANQTKALIR